MANRVHPTPIDADNSSGSLPAVRSDWRVGDADSMSARTTTESTLDAGYTTAGASQKAKTSLSLLRLWGSPYTELRAKLITIKHIVDYYYEAKQFPKPDFPATIAIDASRQPKSKIESAIREAICYHFSCDGIGVSTLYDVCTMLDESRAEERAYLAVILPCCCLLREHPQKFKTAYS